MKVYHTYNDEELFALLKQGDEEAYATIYKRFWALLYRHALRMLQDVQETEDVIQEVFLTLWNKAEQLELKNSLSGYLYAAVRNRIFDHIEHGKVKSKHMESLGTFMERSTYETDHLIRERQLRELIEQEIAALPQPMRHIFELSRHGNLSHRQIAEELHVSEGAVRNQVSRALKILRSKLGIMAFLYMILTNW